MGNILSSSSLLKVKVDRDKISSESECKYFMKVKEIWQIMEQNTSYYGFSFCTVIFRNHPKYVKYFENEAIPEFVQEAKIKKKFSIICDVMCALFIDYYDKPSKRDHILGYIAMVHKDLGLTLKDYRNFLSDVLKAIIIELPQIMNEEYILAQSTYFSIVAEIVWKLMIELNKEMTQMLLMDTGVKKCCMWNMDPESQIVYGYPVKYWVYKKRYWEYRRALWASVEADALVNTTEFNTIKTKKRRSRMKSAERRRLNRRRQIEPRKLNSSDSDAASQLQRGRARTSSSKQSARISWLLAKDRIFRERQIGGNYKSKFSPLETIQEISST
ncbi:unnamed protein product [Xylocopa violacea]|uniref:Globin family profile domain-containing protein n=1 Tax=Xylocopa violacea TaxID=135666 RepID=A0ABP1N514_XYLVO